MKTINDATKSITKELNSTGVLIKDRTVKMILEAYFDYKRMQLMMGESIDEPKVGTIKPTFRRSNTFNNTVTPTVKFVTKENRRIKTALLENICTNEKIRNKIAPSMTLEELGYLQDKMGVK